jgi:hypothetical protein
MNLVLKVLLLSAGLSVAIKYLAPSLNIPVTSPNALIAVLLPSLLMAVLLIWRGQQSPSEKEIN